MPVNWADQFELQEEKHHGTDQIAPGAEIADAVMGCGSTTGRDTDKAAKFNIELASLPGSAIQVPAHSRVAIQCHMKEFHEVGDHYLYICEVEKVYMSC